MFDELSRVVEHGLKVKKWMIRRTVLERPATEGDSPVSENLPSFKTYVGASILKYPGTRQSWVNPPLLRGKAKYS